MGEIWQNFILILVDALKLLHGYVASYGIAGSYGIAIILFTIAVRLVFLPLSIKSTNSMRQMQINQAKMKPYMDALQKKYGNDRAKLLEEQQKLYKEHGINPMAGLGGCLPMLIQMPIWIALYSALITLSHTAEFAAPFLWIPNLGLHEGPPYLLAIITGVTQWVTSRMTMTASTDPQQKSMNTMMQIMMPAMMVFFAFQVPAGLVLYWVTSNIFQFFQQLFTYGWGSLLPSRAAQATAVAARGSKPAGEPAPVPQIEESKQVERSEARPRKESRNGSSNGKAGEQPTARVQLLPESSSRLRNGIRIYSLDAGDDGEADISAEGPSQSVEESIARAKGQQQRPRKKKRKA